MRAIGLLCLLVGSAVLALPIFNQLAHTRFHFEGSQIISGVLLSIGVITLILTRGAA